MSYLIFLTGPSTTTSVPTTTRFPFTQSPGVTTAITENKPISFFRLFWSSEVNNLIYTETIRHGEQQLQESENYLIQHKHARGNVWRRNPLLPEEVDPLVAIIILMGLVNYPTVRYKKAIEINTQQIIITL